jgi:hypothetical protein
VNDAETRANTYAIDSFSPDRKSVRGPSDLPQDDALDYLAQRLADQHRGGLTPVYWRTRAASILEEAAQKPHAACIHRVSRGRGVIVTAEPVTSAAVYEVRIFPVFDDDGGPGELCAAFDHPRLTIAMREAGLRAEAWTRVDSEEVRVQQERGPLIGFDAEVTARLTVPLLPSRSAEAATAEVPAHAPRGGWAEEGAVTTPPSASAA